MLEKMLINTARKAMLENITALDKKTLQRELETHLKLEFKYKDEVDNLKILIRTLNRSIVELKYCSDDELELLNSVLAGDEK